MLTWLLFEVLPAKVLRRIGERFYGVNFHDWLCPCMLEIGDEDDSLCTSEAA